MLAPLAGVSDSPFRQLAREQGAAAVYTEMVSSDGLVRGSQATLEYCAFEPHERPIGIQLFGSDPAVMADADARALGPAARAASRHGRHQHGLPRAQGREPLRRRGAAAGRFAHHRASSRAMSEATDLPVTAKIRLGWDGQSRNVVDVAKALEGAGAKAVAIHARTRAEKFEGTAHWDMIAEARRAVGIPVIGNGDVRDARDAVRMLETTGCDAVMLGRAAFGDPWIFRRIRALAERGEVLPPPTAQERLETGIRHLEMLVRSSGEAVAAKEMRKHVAWYIKGLPHSARVREQVNHTRSAAEMADLLRAYLGDLAAHGLEAFAPEPAAAPAGGLRATG